ncbi:MAG: enoyl-CoA hydratase-related protein [Chloroflexota bacterium]
MSVVLFEKKGNIAYITLNRPEKLNAIDDEVVQGLQKAWVDFREDDSLWVAVVSGNGRAFCAGGSISPGELHKAVPVRTGPPPTTIRGEAKTMQTMPIGFEIWKPIICAVHGYVYGAGAWLALTCDVRIAADDARLGVPEVQVGRGVTFAGLISRYLPIGIASELLLWGDPINAERAYSLGLFNKVVPKAELMVTATKLAERMCENAPIAVRITKEIMLKSLEMPSFEGRMAITEALFPRVADSEDYKEGTNAFQAKRKPVWKGK